MRLNALVVTPVTLLLLGPASGAAQEDAFSLDGLVVTATPTPRGAGSVGGHVTVLSGDDLRSRGLTALGEALRGVAGLEVARNGSFGALTSVFVRGGEGDYALVLVDGVQVNQAGGGFDFASLTLDDVERIEIIRGPHSALYGSDAVTGVIHVLTRTGRGPPRVTATVESAHYGEPRDELLDGVRLSTGIRGGSERFGYAASLSRESTDGLLEFNNRFRSTVLAGNARFIPDDRTRLSLSLRLSGREFHFPTDGAGGVVDVNAFGFADQAVAGVNAARKVSDAIELSARLSVHDIDGGTDDAPDGASDADAYRSLDHFRRTTGEVRANVLVGDAVITVGGEAEEERQRSFSESLSTFGPFHSRAENTRRNLAAFVHTSGDHGPFSVNGGARVEDNERFGTSMTWQAGLVVRLPWVSALSFSASMGTALKEPTFYENFAADGFSVGNPDLEPERSSAWEVALSYEVAPGLGLRAAYFDQRFEEMIQFTFAASSPGAPNFFNVAEATARGLEAGVDVQEGAIDLGAEYTWLLTRVENPGFDSGPGAYFVDGEALLRRPSHSLSFRVGGALAERGRVHAQLSWVGSRADRRFDPETFETTRVTLPRYVLVGVGTSWTLTSRPRGGPSLSMSVRVENLLGEKYEEAVGFGAPGRQLYVGWTLALGGGTS